MSHGLPTRDPFSVETGISAFAFINVPWLAQVIAFQVWQRLGLEGLTLGHALLAALSCGLLMGAIRARDVGPPWAVLGSAISFLTVIPQLETTLPQLFGMVAFPTVLIAVGLVSRRWSACLWLPPIFALWANLHGSFALGLATLVLCAVGDTWESWRESGRFARAPGRPAVWRKWVLVAVSVAAACLNPMGPSLLWKVFHHGWNPVLADIDDQDLIIGIVQLH